MVGDEAVKVTDNDNPVFGSGRKKERRRKITGHRRTVEETVQVQARKGTVLRTGAGQGIMI